MPCVADSHVMPPTYRPPDLSTPATRAGLAFPPHDGVTIRRADQPATVAVTPRPATPRAEGGLRRRLDLLYDLREQLRTRGADWAAVKAWALDRGWQPASVTVQSPLAIQAWLDAHPAGEEDQ